MRHPANYELRYELRRWGTEARNVRRTTQVPCSCHPAERERHPVSSATTNCTRSGHCWGPFLRVDSPIPYTFGRSVWRRFKCLRNLLSSRQNSVLNNWLHGVEFFLSSHTVNQETVCLLWSTKVHYLVHKSPPPFSALNQMRPVHNPPPFFPKIHSNTVLPSTPRSSKLSSPFRFSDQNIVYFISPMRAIFHADLIVLKSITVIIFCEAYKLRSSTLCSLL